MNDQIDLIPVIDNKIGGTLKGRYILEVEVELFEDKDFEMFNGFQMIIKRDEDNVRMYPNQKFTFLIKNTENNWKDK